MEGLKAVGLWVFIILTFFVVYFIGVYVGEQITGMDRMYRARCTDIVQRGDRLICEIDMQNENDKLIIYKEKI